MNRRDFLRNSTAATAGAAVAGPKMAFGADPYSDNILVFVFQRGGIDGLSFMAPMDGHTDRGNYETLRFNGTMIPSIDLQSVDNGWGLHPSAAPLLDLYTNNSLAIVQAVGLTPFPNRSHFEAERYIELGTPGDRNTPTGWLTRHLQTANNLPGTSLLPAVVTESTIRLSLKGEPSAVSLRYPSSFDFDDSGGYENEQELAVKSMYELNNGAMDVAGAQAMAAQQIVQAITFDLSGVLPSNPLYPRPLDNPDSLTSFGYEMKILATLIKEDVGMHVAETDIGGWDTHNGQGNLPSTDWFYDNVRDFSQSLLAFFDDIDVMSPNGKTWLERTTVIVASEFGRRAYDNADIGTDHGWGNNVLVAGGGVNGGQLYGPWPGLAPEALYQNADVWAQTDFRTIFSEVLIKRFHNNQLYQIFPGYTAQQYQPLGVVSGSLMNPDFNDPEVMFEDGME